MAGEGMRPGGASAGTGYGPLGADIGASKANVGGKCDKACDRNERDAMGDGDANDAGAACGRDDAVVRGFGETCRTGEATVGGGDSACRNGERADDAVAEPRDAASQAKCAASGAGRGKRRDAGRATAAAGTGAGSRGRGVAAAAKPGARRKAKRPSMAVRRACFIEALRQSGIVSRAAREAGLSSSAAYAHRTRSAAFRTNWDAALGEALDEVEAQLLERARNGVEKPVYYRGEVVGSVRSYSDALAMFLLKAKRPEVYDRLGGANRQVGEAIGEDAARAEVLRRLDRLGEDDAAEGDAVDAGEGA